MNDPQETNVKLTPGEAVELAMNMQRVYATAQAAKQAQEQQRAWMAKKGLDPERTYRMDEDTGELIPAEMPRATN